MDKGLGAEAYFEATLVDSIDRLRETTDKNSQATNDLTAKIKTLTWVIVVISFIGLLIAGYGVFFK